SKVQWVIGESGATGQEVAEMAAPSTQSSGVASVLGKSAYEQWTESTGVPIHKGYFIDDVRTVEVGPWPERECNAAFLARAGQAAGSEARVTEIPPGKTLPPLKFALDEIVYVADGRGLTTVWSGNGEKRTFEWQKHSMFILPRNCTHQLSNAQ